MSLADLFQSFISQQGDGGGGDSTPVDGVTVTGGGRPKPGPNVSMAPPPNQPQVAPPSNTQLAPPSRLNYNNANDVEAVNNAVAGEGTPRGGMANPGLYGLLPQNMQHGTLRNLLGALGDAFLVGGGGQAQYEPRMQRQEEGQAMAGVDLNDPDSVAAGTQRLMATGAAGSPELADKYNEQSTQAALRRATMEQTATYRQQLGQSRDENILARRAASVTGMLSSASTPQEYATRYAQAEAMAQSIGPQYHASDFGAIDPQYWRPGMIQGQTGNQQVQHQDRLANQADARRGQDLNYAGRIGGARIAAGAHNHVQEGDIDQQVINQENSGQPLSPGQANWEARHTPRGRRPPPTTGGGVAPVTMAQVQTLGPGATNGHSGGPTNTDIQYLRSNPHMRAAFDAHFGRGASNRFLGR